MSCTFERNTKLSQTKRALILCKPIVRLVIYLSTSSNRKGHIHNNKTKAITVLLYCSRHLIDNYMPSFLESSSPSAKDLGCRQYGQRDSVTW